MKWKWFVSREVVWEGGTVTLYRPVWSLNSLTTHENIIWDSIVLGLCWFDLITPNQDCGALQCRPEEIFAFEFACLRVTEGNWFQILKNGNLRNEKFSILFWLSLCSSSQLFRIPLARLRRIEFKVDLRVSELNEWAKVYVEKLFLIIHSCYFFRNILTLLRSLLIFISEKGWLYCNLKL